MHTHGGPFALFKGKNAKERPDGGNAFVLNLFLINYGGGNSNFKKIIKSATLYRKTGNSEFRSGEGP